MIMQEPISYLGYKISDKMFNFDLIGTDKMLVYRLYDRKLILMTKDGIIMSETDTVIEYNFEQFIAKAQEIFTAALDYSDITVVDYQISWS